MKKIIAVVALVLASCGQAPPDDVATLRAYTDAHGNPTPHASSLGFCYGPVDGDGAEYETPGWNLLINQMTSSDPDIDRQTRVCIHEIENAQVLRQGGWPDALGEQWYLWSSENRSPFEAPGEEEGEWLASLPVLFVGTHERDVWWLKFYRDESVERLNVAAGREVFR